MPGRPLTAPQRTTVAILAGLVACAVLGASAPARAEDARVWAVVSVAGQGAWAPDVERVERAVSAALAKKDVGRVLARAETIAQIEDARRSGASCPLQDPACAARFGALAGVDRVAIVEVGADAASSLVFVDVAQSVVIGRATGQLAPQDAKLAAVADELVARALDPASAVPEPAPPPPVVEPPPPPAVVAAAPAPTALAAAEEAGLSPLAMAGGAVGAVGAATLVAGAATAGAFEIALSQPANLVDRPGFYTGGYIGLAIAAAGAVVGGAGLALYLLAPPGDAS